MFNKRIIIHFLLLTLFIITIDLFYLTINRKLYQDNILLIQNKPLRTNLIAGGVVYLILTSIIIFIIEPLVDCKKNENNKNQLLLILLYSFICSLGSYGVFNFTNIAIFDDYKFKTGIIDIIWGFILLTTSSLFYIFIILKKF